MNLSQLAWLDASRRLRMGTAPAPTFDALTWGAWSEPAQQEVHSWPTWSPDGQRVASFRLGRSDGAVACHVRITDALGVDAVEIAELTGRLPIYLQWACHSEHLHVLTQEGDLLILEQAWPDRPGVVRKRLTGSPLFFHGTRDRRLVVFAGEATAGAAEAPKLLVLSNDGSRLQLAGVPGNFCAPIVLGEEVAYVRVDSGRPELHVAPLSGGPTRKLRATDGLAAMLPSPDGERLAWSVAADGTGDAYQGIELIDPKTGLSERIADAEVVAFSWLPDGSGLITASRTSEGTVAWSRVGLDGHTLALGALHPTRDMRFYLRFFEQFALSHPLVSADGRYLVVAGGWAGHDDPRGTPRIWAVPTEGGEVEAVDEGVFATFARPDEEHDDGDS